MSEDMGLNVKVGLDGSGFSVGIGKVNDQLNYAKAQFKEASSRLGDFGSGTDKLKLKAQYLSKQIDIQKNSVDSLDAKYRQAKSSTNANELATQRLATQLLNAKEKLNMMGNELNRTNSDLKNFDKTQRNAERSGSSFASKLGGGMKTAAKGLAIGIGAVAGATSIAAAGMGRMIQKSVESADKIQTTAEVYGMTAERVQELTYVGTKLDVNIESITKGQRFLAKNMYAAEQGTKGQAAAFKKLGVSVVDSKGKLRNANDTMADTFTALKNMPNATERNAVAMKIFGKSAMDLNPLIQAGGKEIAGLTDEAHKMGAVISNEAIKGLDDFADSFDGLKLGIKGIAGTLSAAFLPAMNGLMGFVQGLIPVLQKAIKTGNFTELGKTIGEGIEKGISKLSVGMTKIMPVIINVLSSIIGAVVKAIPVILPALTDGVILLLNALINILSVNAPVLIKAAMQMVVTLADGILKAIPKLIPMAITLILSLVDALMTNLPKLIRASIKIIVSLAQGLIKSLPKLIKEIPKIIIAIVTALVENIDPLIDGAIAIIMAIVDFLLDPDNIKMLISASFKIIGALINGLIKAIPKLVVGVGKLMAKIIDKIIHTNWLKLGGDIVKGIIDGMVNVGGAVWDGIKNVGKSLVNGFKNFFGIHSPSKLMRDEIGHHLGLGIAEGLLGVDYTSGLSRKVVGMRNAVSSSLGGFSVNAGMTGGFNASSTATNYGDTNINFNGSYSFSNRSDIDYFMNQAGLMVKRRVG
ncbi:MAG: hypothetical protein WC677_02645 [Clostridia bacterium]|jgi:phage-related protein